MSTKAAVTMYDVTSIPNDFNIRTIFDLINSGRIVMPLFQRSYVWDKKRASKFVESLIMGLPIPPIFLYQEEKNKFVVIDGQQRLLSLYYFIKQRFPRKDSKTFARTIFDKHGMIPDENLFSDENFEDFKLQFAKSETGVKHPLNSLRYATLGEYKDAFDYATIRCIAIKQNEPKDDDSSIFEIFNRLNTGGVNLNPQEIRVSLYYSPFFENLIELNHSTQWRTFQKKTHPDTRMTDIDYLLRSFAFLICADKYKSSMNAFLSVFAKNARGFTDDENVFLKKLFETFLAAISSFPPDTFLTINNTFNIALFECVFSTVCRTAFRNKSFEVPAITLESVNRLKNDPEFISTVTHSSSHVKSIDKRFELAKKYLAH